MHELDVGRGAHEGERDEVDTEFQRELEVRDVLLGEGGNGDVHAGQRDALVVGHLTTFDDLADDVVAVDLDTHEADLAVVDQEPVSGPGVLGEVLVGGGHAVVGADNVVDGDPHRFTGGPHLRAVREPAETDLRPLQVGEDTDGAPGGVGRFAYPPVVLFMVWVVTVREIEAGDVHARVNQGFDPFFARDGRSEGAYNLGSSIHVPDCSPLCPETPPVEAFWPTPAHVMPGL